MTEQTEPAASDDAPAKDPVAAAVEHAVEVFVYAPIGLLFEGASLLPQLIEKGKSQVAMAKVLGQFAVTQGRGEAEKLAGKLTEQAVGLVGQVAEAVSVVPKSVPAPMATAAQSATSIAKHAVDGAKDAAGQVTGIVVDVTSLAIPDYDGLSASHVVNRLAGLSPTELESVRLYELANRGRKTILSKVAQLQSG